MTSALEMRGIEKRFGAVVALAGVDLTVSSGEVHALVGENGAGKSTLMKVLSGAVSPDAGSLTLAGEPFVPTGPLSALRRGVAMIYQELNLAPELTVAQNVFLGREPSRYGWVDRGRAADATRDALAFLEHEDIDPTHRVAGLGPGKRQIVEIARALAADARIIVMDEPTSSLSRTDGDRLLTLVRRLGERGVSIVYISHFLEEVKRVADRFTVLRDGKTVATGEVADTDTRTIVEHMVGRSVSEIFPRVPHEPGDVVLSAAGLAGEGLPVDASFELHRGEILGVAGLVGAGRTEMLRALFGLEPVRAGRVSVAGVDATGWTPHSRLAEGVGLLSEDRKDEGLALSRSVAENVTLSMTRVFARFGVIDASARHALVRRWIDDLGIKCRDAAQPVRELSGGNQQKVALARLLHHDVDVLLLDEPTRGVDVGSKVEIYRLVGELAAKGKAILFVSSYVPELLGVCDRIAVMHRGVLGESKPVSEWNEVAIIDEAARGKQPSEDAA